ncbi:MAG: single-stranded DNA-binding protein [Bacteroidaceae bacterium]|nr:single-stranded DNA-binding protein [Bacteroidaceae bacterium]
MNQLQIIGNLTRDVELTQSQQGDQFMRFTVAVNSGKNQDAMFIGVVQKLYPNQQNGLLPYLLKGQKVFAQGRMTASVYQSKQDNQFKPDITLWADKIELVGSAEQKAAQQSQEAPQGSQVQQKGNVIYPSRLEAQAQQVPQSQTTDLPF